MKDNLLGLEPTLVGATFRIFISSRSLWNEVEILFAILLSFSSSLSPPAKAS